MLTLANDFKDLIPLVGIAGGCGIAAIAIISGAVRSVVRSRHREESRREIAAYVAEGSITPDDAERLLKAGGDASGCCGRKHA